MSAFCTGFFIYLAFGTLWFASFLEKARRVRDVAMLRIAEEIERGRLPDESEGYRFLRHPLDRFYSSKWTPPNLPAAERREMLRARRKKLFRCYRGAVRRAYRDVVAGTYERRFPELTRDIRAVDTRALRVRDIALLPLAIPAFAVSATLVVAVVQWALGGV